MWVAEVKNDSAAAFLLDEDGDGHQGADPFAPEGQDAVGQQDLAFHVRSTHRARGHHVGTAPHLIRECTGKSPASRDAPFFPAAFQQPDSVSIGGD